MDRRHVRSVRRNALFLDRKHSARRVLLNDYCRSILHIATSAAPAIFPHHNVLRTRNDGLSAAVGES